MVSNFLISMLTIKSLYKNQRIMDQQPGTISSAAYLIAINTIRKKWNPLHKLLITVISIMITPLFLDYQKFPRLVIGVFSNAYRLLIGQAFTRNKLERFMYTIPA